MKVAYLTTYYNGDVDGRFGRFHDWIHTLRDMADPPFEYDVVSLTASNPDETLSSNPHAILGEATDLWGTKRNKLEFALNVPRVLRDLRRLDYDVLHVLTLDTMAYPIALAAAGRSPVVGPDVQGYFPGRAGDRWNQSGLSGFTTRSRFRLRRRLLSLAREPTFVSLSDYHAQNVRSLGVDGPVVRIPPGVDAIFRPMDVDTGASDHDAPTEFLYVGDLSSYKGYDLFLDALTQMPNDQPFEATVVGSGDPDRDRITKLGLADTVTVAGFVPRSQLPRYYRRADFYVMPSVDENGPNTIVESLACGTPVLATDKPGINEYAPEPASIYFERTPSSIRKAMVEAHQNRRAYREAARARADEFRADRTVDALAGIYRDHLDRLE